MNEDQALLLKRRFVDNGTEWRRLYDRIDLERFLFVARLEPPYPRVRPGDLAFTLADGIILETGTLLLSGRLPGARRAAYLAETHMALVSENAVFETLAEFLGWPHRSWHAFTGPALTLITGPSRTADIEKTLVMGAHGPRRLVVGTAPPELIREFFDGGR